MPLIRGLLSLVVAPSASRPRPGPTLSTAPVISRAPTTTAPLAVALRLPAGSLACADSTLPWGRGWVGMTVQLPSAPTVDVPISWPCAPRTTTVVPGSAVPLTT